MNMSFCLYSLYLKFLQNISYFWFGFIKGETSGGSSKTTSQQDVGDEEINELTDNNES